MYKKMEIKDKKHTLEENKISYEDIEAIIEHLVKVKSHSAVFDCWEPDDIAQEIRIICLNALQHFDRSRVKDDKLVNYFGRCVDYRLQNLKRDKYIRFTSYFNKDQIREAEAYPESEIGLKYAKFKEGVKNRKRIKHPICIDQVGEKFHEDTGAELIDMEDFKKHLLHAIPHHLRTPLLIMMEGGGKKVEKEVREEVQAFVQQCIEDMA